MSFQVTQSIVSGSVDIIGGNVEINKPSGPNIDQLIGICVVSQTFLNFIIFWDFWSPSGDREVLVIQSKVFNLTPSNFS